MLGRVARVVVLGMILLTVVFGPSKAEAMSSPPRLLVFIIVDQMRADYVDRFRHQWRGGLKRLLDRGAVFVHASYPYLATVTCAGHATLSTGTYPATHGMVLNAWWDRATKKLLPCTDDSTVTLVPYGQKTPKDVGDSIKNLRVPTLTDEMRAQLWPRPRVATISLKARSAILLAGRKADAVTWVEKGNWVTSSAYTETPVAFVGTALAKIPMSRSADGSWAKLLPAKSYLYRDDATEERPPSGWTNVFPHPLRSESSTPGTVSASLWERSPEADAYLAKLAIAKVSALTLGTGAAPTDFLGISFSSLDLLGHAFGPRSHEVQDMLARLDVTLGELFGELDRRVGQDAYTVAFSSDHGIAPFPEQMKPEGLDAGRISSTEVKKALDQAIAKTIGDGDHVAMVYYTDVYLAPGVVDRLRRHPGAMESVLHAAREVPGVAAAFFADDLARGLARDPLHRAAKLSYFPGRSGDIMLAPRPYWVPTSSGTTHGTQNGYDQKVPLILMGTGIKPGVYMRPVSPADVSPTLATISGITLAHSEGSPLIEAIRPPTNSRAPRKR
jgi:predicted AlkP superfamily pyrophosphatase or phosphodiesterase